MKNRKTQQTPPPAQATKPQKGAREANTGKGVKPPPVMQPGVVDGYIIPANKPNIPYIPPPKMTIPFDIKPGQIEKLETYYINLFLIQSLAMVKESGGLDNNQNLLDSIDNEIAAILRRNTIPENIFSIKTETQKTQVAQMFNLDPTIIAKYKINETRNSGSDNIRGSLAFKLGTQLTSIIDESEYYRTAGYQYNTLLTSLGEIKRIYKNLYNDQRIIEICDRWISKAQANIQGSIFGQEIDQFQNDIQNIRSLLKI